MQNDSFQGTSIPQKDKVFYYSRGRRIPIGDKAVILELTDSNGRKALDSVNHCQRNDVDGVIIVYDVCYRTSFMTIEPE